MSMRKSTTSAAQPGSSNHNSVPLVAAGGEQQTSQNKSPEKQVKSASRVRSASRKSSPDMKLQESFSVNGKYAVEIEVCRNCKEHQWCTRHDEARYNRIYEEVAAAILSENPNTHVRKNAKVNVPVLGGFEVSCFGTLLYSKNKCGAFPSPSALAQLVKSFLVDKINGNSVTQYDLNQSSSSSRLEDSRGSNQMQPNPSRRARSPIREAKMKGTRGRSSHYSGQGNVITPYQFVISSTFGHGKRGTEGRSLSMSRADTVIGGATITSTSGFYNPPESADQNGAEEIQQQQQHHDPNYLSPEEQEEQDRRDEERAEALRREKQNELEQNRVLAADRRTSNVQSNQRQRRDSTKDEPEESQVVVHAGELVVEDNQLQVEPLPADPLVIHQAPNEQEAQPE